MKNIKLKKKIIYFFFLLPITIAAQFSNEKIIAHYNGDVWFIDYGDLDRDGDLDIISGGLWDNQLRWHENEGTGTFSSPKVISTKIDGLESGVIGDLDQDGDMDVVSASAIDSKLAIYRNDGNGNFSEQEVVSLDINRNRFSNMVFLEDLDADNDLDIIYFSSKEILWYKNNGTGEFTNKISIIVMSNAYAAGQIIDIDADGDLDIISAAGGNAQEIICLKNNGLGSFSAPIMIVNDEIDIESISVTDLDEDGDLDIVVGAYEKNMIAWFEQIGDKVYAEKKIISTAINSPEYVSSADLDKDGDNDVLSVSWGDGKVAWYENRGNGNFSEQKVFGGFAEKPVMIHPVDLDSDGDKDILFGTMGNNKIAWFENLLEITCPEDLTTEEIGSVLSSRTYRAITTITSDGLIEKDSFVNLKAGETISLISGFHAMRGSEIIVQIMPCQINPTSTFYSDTVSIRRENMLSNNTKSLTEDIVKVYPNPFNSHLTIEGDLSQFPDSPIFSIFDISGKRITSTVLENNMHNIQLSYLFNGLYFYQITDASGQIIDSDKIIKN